MDITHSWRLVVVAVRAFDTTAATILFEIAPVWFFLWLTLGFHYFRSLRFMWIVVVRKRCMINRLNVWASSIIYNHRLRFFLLWIMLLLFFLMFGENLLFFKLIHLSMSTWLRSYKTSFLSQGIIVINFRVFFVRFKRVMLSIFRYFNLWNVIWLFYMVIFIILKYTEANFFFFLFYIYEVFWIIRVHWAVSLDVIVTRADFVDFLNSSIVIRLELGIILFSTCTFSQLLNSIIHHHLILILKTFRIRWARYPNSIIPIATCVQIIRL